MDEFDQQFRELIDQLLHQRFLKEYGREPKSAEEQRDFVHKNLKAVCREIESDIAKEYQAPKENGTHSS
jgi:hypothetical protein